MNGRCSGRTSSAASGFGGASSRSMPDSCLTRICLIRSPSIDGRAHDVDDALAVEPEVEEHAVVAELQVAVDEADLAAELAVERDGGVDGDGRRPDAALGAVEREDPAERRACQEHVARREAGQQALDPGQQLRRVERLDQVVVGTGAEALDLLLDLALGGQHDDRDVGRLALLRPDLGRDLVAVQLGQHHVEEDQVRPLGAPQPEAFGTIRRHDDVVALLLQGVLQQPLDIRVVIDDQDLGRHQSSERVAGCGSAGLGPGVAIIGRRLRRPRGPHRSCPRTPIGSRSRAGPRPHGRPPRTRSGPRACRSRGS